MPTKKTAPHVRSKRIYVGRIDPSGFLRTFEEHDADVDEFSYRVFETSTRPSKKSYTVYNAVIGPFRTMAGAIVFRDQEGVNDVEEAESIEIGAVHAEEGRGRKDRGPWMNVRIASLSR